MLLGSVNLQILHLKYCWHGTAVIFNLHGVKQINTLVTMPLLSKHLFKSSDFSVSLGRLLKTGGTALATVRVRLGLGLGLD